MGGNLEDYRGALTTQQGRKQRLEGRLAKAKADLAKLDEKIKSAAESEKKSLQKTRALLAANIEKLRDDIDQSGNIISDLEAAIAKLKK